MDIEFNRNDGNVIAMVSGSVDGNNAALFQSTLQGAVEQSDKALVLNFSGLGYISSAGLRVLLLVGKEMQKSGTGFGLCSLQGQVRELFTVSGFDQIIPIHEDQEAALAAMNG